MNKNKKPPVPLPPALPGEFLQRERVDAILEHCQKSFVTIITAGEGYGKTYAVSSFLLKKPEQTIWVQLSARDNHPGHFWENISKSIGLIDHRVGKSMVEMGFPDTGRMIYHHLAVLEREMIAGKNYVMVFDDFHMIQAKPVWEFMERILAVPISHYRFIFICRHEPAFNTVPILSKGNLIRVGADELRFNEMEIEALFRQRKILLTEQELRDIHHDTEGWALAVNFLAGEMEKYKKPYTRGLLNTGMVRDLVDTAYQKMDGGVKKFLIELSLLERWPRDLLELLAPRKMVIEEMEKFSSLIWFDSYLNGYRIHRIFLDYLQKKQKELAGEELKEKSVRIAEWCVQNGLYTDAAIHLARARSYQGLVDLVSLFPRIMTRTTASSLLDILTDLYTAPDRDEADGNFLILRYVVRPQLLLNLGRFDDSTAELKEAIAYFETLPPSPLSSHILSECYTGLGSLSLILCRYTRNYFGVDNYIRANYYHMRNPWEGGGRVAKTSILSYVSQVPHPLEPGEFEGALQAFAAAVPHAANVLDGFLYGADDLAYAEMAYFKSDLNGAEQFARQAVFKAREKRQYETENRGLFFLLRILLHEGNYRGITEILRQLEAQLAVTGYFNRHVNHDIVTGWFYAHIGEPDRLARWLLSEFEEEELNSLFNHLEILIKAKWFFAEKRYDAVMEILASEEYNKSLGTYILGFLEMKALEAVSRYHRGDRKGALKILKTAYEVSVPSSLDMPFIELGDDMRLLLGAALEDKTCSIPRKWLEGIRSRASAYAKKISLVKKCHEDEKNARIFLTRKEKLMLTNLSKGFTWEEIAENEGLSIGAVKTTMKLLYKKLGALNGADAVRIATRRDLV
ncbi:MAG: LuxR C-terminal-related transcriptional regulator [Spirochaetaceae bacterium]|nr:LuxR C-terminal-related transcriptional regulator [Spirochaetaceae bacterium]